MIFINDTPHTGTIFRTHDHDPAVPALRAAERRGDGMTVRLFLCGDVMLGRGIDQILSCPGEPTLHEDYAKSAIDYVNLAERASGPLPRRVADGYVWGETLAELRRPDCAARIVNLETSITTSKAFEPKGINYRMHPANAGVLAIAGIDCCVLANNHVLDWGQEGLEETLRTLDKTGIRHTGAGRNAKAAAAPASIALPDGRTVHVFAFGHSSSGIPPAWAAEPAAPGVNLLPDFSPATVAGIARLTGPWRRPGHVLLASIHWGGNWGYAVSPSQRAFARALVDAAGFDVVHGHSSHHAKGIEIYRDRLILYGCGDFITDYEGIGGYEEFRGDLSVAYFACVSPDGTLADLEMSIYQLRKFRLCRASVSDSCWLEEKLNRESAPFGTRIKPAGDNRLRVERAAPT